jgi:hypothetical protein
MDETTAAKTQKRPGGKGGRGVKSAQRPSADRVKVSLVLSADVDFKLTVHAAALRSDRSALANQILGDALKRFVVQDRMRPEESPEPK